LQWFLYLPSISTMKLVFALAGCAAGQDVFLASNGASKADLARAQLRSQPGRLAGRSAEEIAEKLNEHMAKVVATKPCDDHSIEELNDAVRGMFGQLSDELQQIYADSGDSRSRRFATLAEYEQSWMAEEDSLTLRHAKCFEIAEMWAHHLSDAAKRSGGKTVPTVPVLESTKTDDKLYESRATCQTGHAMVKGGDGTSTHECPDWPEELHYKAKAHGAYPFWWGGGSDSGVADMEVYWSEKQGAEKFIHSSCTGQSSWLNGACTHLMIAGNSADASDAQAYLYKADESRCCLSQPSGGGFGPSEKLSVAQGNFYKTMQYVDERDFNGVNYQGKVKYYKLTGVNEPVREFWYFTDLDGKPVQQGEAGTGPTDQGYPTSIGHTIWHDYDQSSFDTSAIDPSVFAVPESCKTTTLKCNFP